MVENFHDMALKKLGKYELIEELGRGGYGTVYRARETVLDVERAIKVLHPPLVSDPEFIERFRREARTTAQLEHSNIVPVYELDELGGAYFLVMRYLAGGSLKQLLEREGRLTFDRAVEIIRQVAAALDFAHGHERNLIHRDVKPGNILFEADGETVRLSDFGFAKALSGARSASTGGMIGTPAYMAPEVWRGQAVSPATDVYSLGCVVYEMITGEVLFKGDSPAEIMTRHVLDGPQLTEIWAEDIPEDINQILSQVLAMEVADRLPGAQKLASALTGLETPAQKQVRLKTEADEQARKAVEDQSLKGVVRKPQDGIPEQQSLGHNREKQSTSIQRKKHRQEDEDIVLGIAQEPVKSLLKKNSLL